jgi:putative restriction endonuclease
MEIVFPLLHQLESINVWRSGTQRAPHKPLLLLMALAGVLRGEARLQPYVQIEEKLRALLTEFGPYRQSYHPEYPFWRLQNDGDFWEIPQRDAVLKDLQGRKRTGDVPPSVLREHDATGGFSQEAYDALKDDPRLVMKASL